MSTAVSLRAAVADDQKYLLSTMREVLLKQSAFYSGLHPATMSILLEPLLATYQTTVAVSTDDPSTIVGFIVYRDPNTVAFIYVRSQFRKFSALNPKGMIATALLKHAGIQKGEVFCALMVTKFNGKNFAQFADERGYRVRFRPFSPLEISADLHYERKARE